MASWVELEHSTVYFLHVKGEKKISHFPAFFFTVWMLVYLLNRDLSLLGKKERHFLLKCHIYLSYSLSICSQPLFLIYFLSRKEESEKHYTLLLWREGGVANDRDIQWKRNVGESANKELSRYLVYAYASYSFRSTAHKQKKLALTHIQTY